MVDWEKVFSSGEPETVWARFSQIISQLIDIAVPIRVHKSKLQKPLWETPNNQKAHKKRNKAERLYLASKSDDHKSLRKEAAAVLKHEASHAIKSYEQKLAQNFDPKPL